MHFSLLRDFVFREVTSLNQGVQSVRRMAKRFKTDRHPVIGDRYN
jgi:hypothetical protein